MADVGSTSEADNRLISFYKKMSENMRNGPEHQIKMSDYDSIKREAYEAGLGFGTGGSGTNNPLSSQKRTDSPPLTPTGEAARMIGRHEDIQILDDPIQVEGTPKAETKSNDGELRFVTDGVTRFYGPKLGIHAPQDDAIQVDGTPKAGTGPLSEGGNIGIGEGRIRIVANPKAGTTSPEAPLHVKPGPLLTWVLTPASALESEPLTANAANWTTTPESKITP